MLAAAAKMVPNWEVAAVKLNQIQLYSWDLDMLKSWIGKSPHGIKRNNIIDQIEFRPVYQQELSSHGLDKHGLVVAQGGRIKAPLPNHPATAPPRPPIPGKRQICDSLESENNINRTPKRQQ
ncbi:hypothetical protein ACHAO7_011883 [Fusarium culmorum]